MAITPQYRKKLIEVALPLEAINKESVREKSIRHGHPSTLHLWWARRPLAACRAVLFASIVDDPSAWPEHFPTEEKQKAERERLFKIIEELVIWENSNDSDTLYKAHNEIARSISRSRGETMPEGVGAIQKYISEHAPPVLDPFCGGGSIPLEAQRLGLEAHGSDLNPVAVLITKALIEIPPKFAGKPPVNPETRAQKTIEGKWDGAKGLAEDVRYYGKWMRDEAEKRIGRLYPKIKITQEMAKERPDLKKYVGKELTVIAWLWARTVVSPNPAVKGAHVPLVRSFSLSTKAGKEAWVVPVIDKNSNSYRFEVRVIGNGGTPLTEGTISKKIKGGRCLISGVPMPFPYIREEAKKGKMGIRLLAVVTKGERGRVYLSPDETQIAIASQALPSWRPDVEMPKKHRNFQPPVYGMDNIGDLFTSRQLNALNTLSDLVQETRSKVLTDAISAGSFPADERRLEVGGSGISAYADAVVTYLAMGVDKSVNYGSSLCAWASPTQKMVSTFSRQALPMVWDFAEVNPFSDSSGNFYSGVLQSEEVLEMCPASRQGYAKQLDAVQIINGLTSPVISTDPPYYDNIAYADLSDFFYVWLRRSLGSQYPSIFATLVTPKKQELIASVYRHNGNWDAAMKFFEQGLGESFLKMYNAQNPNYPLTVYYAFKQTETDVGDDDSDTNSSVLASTGWDTMLTGLIRSGFSIQGTWPMRTELIGNLKKQMSSLASSIVLVCRPRPANAPLATRREFITALKQELPAALKTLQQSSIAPVDLAQASIGPGMAVFTRYMKVMESDGSPMTVRTALALINQILGEVLAEQEGEFDPDTRWAIAWFEQFGMNEGAFGTAETLSKAKNTAINALVDDGLITARAGKVKLVSRNDLPEDWNPTTDERLTAWESTQYLIRALEQKGESGTAELLKKLGSGMGETARDLAYRLYVICDRKKWTTEALSYNSLITSWSEIQNLVHAAERSQRGQQTLAGENE